MKHLITLALVAWTLLAGPAAAQNTVLQGGPFTPGHLPGYVGSGTGQAVVIDGGSAAGGGAGANISEIGVVARGTGTPPYAAQGTGPNGETLCSYDAPNTNPTGYHYLCISPNAQGGGLISYGAAGGASSLPLQFLVNGVLTAPGIGTMTSVTQGSGITLTPSPIVSSGSVACTAAGTAAFGCVPASGGGAVNFLRADMTWSTAVKSVIAGTGLSGGTITSTGTIACNTFAAGSVGCVPASGGGTVNFLRADGTWTTVTSGAIVVGTTTLSSGTDKRVLFDDAGVVQENAGLTFTKATAVLTIGSTGQLAFSTDTILLRDAANIFAQRNSTTAQAHRVYNTFTDAANYERGTLDWAQAANVFVVGTEKTGTGVSRDVRFIRGGTTAGTFTAQGLNVAGTSTGTIATNLATSAIFVDRLVVDFANADVTLTRDAAGILAQLNSVTAQAQRIYNTFTSATNYERGTLDWVQAAGVFVVGTEKGAGGGTARDMRFIRGGTTAGTFTAQGLNVAGTSTATLATNLATSAIFVDRLVVDFANADTTLQRDSAAALALRGGVTAQSFRTYNTFTSSTSFESGVFDWQSSANVLTIGTSKGSGGGTARNIRWIAGDVTKSDFGVTTAGAWNFAAHVGSTSAAAPALTSCGGGSPTITATSTDIAGEVTEGTAIGGCVVTFNVAYTTTAPVCVLAPKSAIVAAFSWTVSTTAITVTNTNGSGLVFAYHCSGR